MKTCLNCGKEFPFSVVIDGKKRNLGSRKYCLDCSPFGSGQRKRLSGDSRPNKRGSRHRLPHPNFGKETACTECGRLYVYDHQKGHQATICNSCNANRKRVSVKAKCIEYKGGKCERCNYARCSRALTFHHRDPKEKEFNISGWMTKPWFKITLELDKCDILCANCHMEVEDEIVQKNRESRKNT